MTLPTPTPAELLEDFDPPVRPPSLAPSDVSYAVEDTAVGRILLARNESGALVCSTYIASADAEDHVLDRLARVVSPRVLRHPAVLDDVRRELEAYLTGGLTRFTTPVDPALMTPFQRVVLGRLADTVGYGERTTYGALAAAVDRPRAARAVGAALGTNPLCIVVPCHRVVAGDGSLTGYAGGVAVKERLLALESGAAPPAATSADR